MDTNRGGSCERCGGPNVCGEFLIRVEQQRPDQGWTTTRFVRKQDFCEACFGMLSHLVRQAAVGMGEPGTLGFPVPEGGPSYSSGLNCGLCRSRLEDEAFGIDLVPTERHSAKRGKLRNGGAIQQHRVCFQCRAWCETAAATGAAGQSLQERAREGPFGDWFAGRPTDTVSLGLSDRDAFVVSCVTTEAGFGYRRADGNSVLLSPTETLFVAAGTAVRARRAVDNLQTKHERARVVVVGRPDSLEDAFEAMRLGAGDLLVSPLSPQQVTSAFQRSAEACAGLPRDSRSGLRVYADESPAYGFPANGIRIQIKSPKLFRPTALMIRRFLRGYDRVGVDRNGDLHAVVYCPAEHVPNVIDRLSGLLGPDVKLDAALNLAALRAA